MNKLGSRLRRGFLFFSVLVVAACGGGGGGGGSAPPAPVTPPSGTWFWTHEDTAFTLMTFEVTTSGSQITQMRRNGVVTPGPTGAPLTGTITHRSGNIFSFTLSDGTIGGFFLNSAQTHGAFVDEDFNFGVVQRGATFLPAYNYTDLNGSYTGTSVNITAGFASFTTSSATATCSLPSTCTAVDSGVTTTVNLPSSGFTGCTGGSGASFGRWCATSWSATDATNGSLAAVFLSADKRFGAAYACRNTGTFPAACEFSAWSKL